MIHVDRLAKRFFDLKRGTVTAVEEVSFDVGPGEIFGLLGPNGAGKTTCLRMLGTVLRPTGGAATIAGFDVASQPADVRARIGYMSGSTGLYDRMTARELVEYFGRLHGMPEDRLQARLEMLLETLQMQDFRDTLASKMSTGMRQKVSIARTIIHDPPVLIFDEPTSGLDVLVARSLLQTIAALRAEGKCIIFSTHIMHEVEKLCDRVAIIDRGRVLAQGTLADLRRQSGRDDVEELFFELIAQVDRPGAVPAC